MGFMWKVKNKIVFLRNGFYQNKESGSKDKNALRFTHVTYCAVGNAGDTMLSQCVRREYLAQENVSAWNILQVTDAVTSRTIEEINNTAAIVIGGGGLFIGDTNKNNISGWQWPISKEQLEDIRCPIFIFSVGFNFFRGQPVSEIFKDNLEALIRKAAFVGLRNHGSVEAVRALLPDELKCKVVYQPCITTLISGLYHEKHMTYGKKVAYNVAFDRLEQRFGKNKDRVLKQIAKAAKEISDKGYEVYYVAHMKDDFQFISYLDNEKISYAIVDLTNALPFKIIDFYKKVDIILGMRGHAQMIPFGMNCGIITLGSHDKMKWFLEDIDQTNLYIELQNETDTISQRIVDCFEENYEGGNFEKTIENLKKAQLKLQTITENNFVTIHEVLEARHD